MRISMILLVLGILGSVETARAYEYPLQFTPNPGYRGLVVAGYRFEGNNVVGTCSYYTVSGGGGGKGGGNRGAHKDYGQTCRWDLAGNLLSVQPGAPAAPKPLYTKGTLVVYDQDANGNYTGTDSALPEGGFVNSPGGHYTWVTPNTTAVLPTPMVYTLSTVLKSDGDVPVTIHHVAPSALLGKVALQSNTCDGAIAVGATCSIVVTYDPTKLSSSTGFVNDTFRIDIVSDANASHDFIQTFTVVVKR